MKPPRPDESGHPSGGGELDHPARKPTPARWATRLWPPSLWKERVGVRVRNFIPMKTGIILSSPLERVCPCKTSGKGGQGGFNLTVTPTFPDKSALLSKGNETTSSRFILDTGLRRYDSGFFWRHLPRGEGAGGEAQQKKGARGKFLPLAPSLLTCPVESITSGSTTHRSAHPSPAEEHRSQCNRRRRSGRFRLNPARRNPGCPHHSNQHW